MKYLFLIYLFLNLKNLLLIILFMNFISFIVFFIDKRKSIKSKRRISENTLLLLSFLFGSLGAFLSMKIFRHKTQKLKFRLLIPMFFVLQFVVLYYFFINFI